MTPRHGVAFFLLVSIAAANAFQAPPPSPLARHAHSTERARSYKPRHALHTLRPGAVFAPEMSSSAAASIGFVHPAALPAKSSTFSSSSSLLGAAVVVSVIKASFVLSSSVPASFSLLAHACAGALGGLAALFSETAVSKGLGEAQQESIRHAIKFTTISKAVNSVTFAYISQAMAALGSGGVMVAAAGTGVIATSVQSLFSKQNRKDFIRDNVARNVCQPGLTDCYYMCFH